MMIEPALYIIPSDLGSFDKKKLFPEYNFEVIQTIRHFIAEDEKSAKIFLKRCGVTDNNERKYILLNEHSKDINADDFLFPVLQGLPLGLISEAGCPAVADPGSIIVLEAHLRDVKVIPLIGPSSILLALISSGLNGQSFRFNGYLPVEKNQRRKKIYELDNIVRKTSESQIFIETPYRNNSLLEDLFSVCGQDTLLAISANLTAPDQLIKTAPIGSWKKNPPDLKKIPTVFILGN